MAMVVGVGVTALGLEGQIEQGKTTGDGGTGQGLKALEHFR
jgi:hypothetical protein